jgi:hypothetical protein
MRWIFVAFVALHGLVHFVGFAKAFGWAELPQLQVPISRAAGLLWGFAGLALLVTAALYLMGVRAWWAMALVAVALSQGVILGSWSDARVGTIANLLILAVAVITLLSQAGGGAGGE